MPTTLNCSRLCGRCRRRHQRYHTLAKCRWSQAIWVAGDGRYASVSDCPHSIGRGRAQAQTVVLFEDRAKAEQAKAMIDRLACGNCCLKQHYIVDLGALT